MNLPGVYQLMLGDVTVSSLKKVEVEDLLGREPVKMGGREVREFLKGKTVLITGGGGSIGSELCRQVAAVPDLKQLIIFDIYENNAHAIKLELMDKYPELNLVTLIGSVRNSHRLHKVFETYRPDVVFHAAAHKHVPLMEDSPCEATITPCKRWSFGRIDEIRIICSFSHEHVPANTYVVTISATSLLISM